MAKRSFERLDAQGLKAKKIFSVVTAMRGKVTIHVVSFHSFYLDAIFTQLSRLQQIPD